MVEKKSIITCFSFEDIIQHQEKFTACRTRHQTLGSWLGG